MSDQHDFSPVRALDENGLPVPGALAYFYIPGTTALRPVYADEAETILHPSPLVANSAGVFPAVWSSQLLKCDVRTPAGVSLPGYPMQIAMRSFGGTSGAENVTFAPDADITATNVQDAIVQSYTLNADRLDELGNLAALNQVTTAQFAPAALRLATEGVASPLDTEVPTVASMTTYVAGLVAPYPFKAQFVSTQQTITSAGALTIAHGLGVVPKLVTIELVCTTADAGYSVNDIVPIGIMSAPSGSGDRNLAMVIDATNINVRFASSANAFLVLNFGTGVGVGLVNTSWRVVFRAYA